MIEDAGSIEPSKLEKGFMSAEQYTGQLAALTSVTVTLDKDQPLP